MNLSVKLNGKIVNPEIIYKYKILDGELTKSKNFPFELLLKENGVKVLISDSYASIEVEDGVAFISMHSKNVNLT